MGKRIETKINQFDGGMVNDPRDPSTNTARVISNFDIFTDPHRMIPYYSGESGDSAPTTSVKKNFAIGLWTASTPDEYRLFALGKQSGLDRAEILMKTLTTGGATDLGDNTWATPAGNQAGQNTPNYNLFVYYAKTGKFYGAHTGTHIWAFTPDGSTAFADTAESLTYTEVYQGLVHSKDDVLYIPYFYDGGGTATSVVSAIASKNGAGALNATALSLPKQYKPISICERGNYLAIACAPVSGVGKSVVFLWDRDSVTWNETYDWGEGIIKIIEEVDGVLVGISLSADSTRVKGRVIFRYLSGSQAIKFREFIGGTSTQLSTAKQKINNRLYFMMSISLNGATREGVWSVGRNTLGSPFSVVHERTSNNDTATNITLYNFFFAGDYLFNSHSDAGVDNLTKTDNAEAYSATSIWESKRFNPGGLGNAGKLIGVTVSTDYLPANGQVILKYRKNEETSWTTTIFTNTTNDSISYDAVNIESTGANLPDYDEIEFRIESTGGAVITGFSFVTEIIDSGKYQK